MPFTYREVQLLEYSTEMQTLGSCLKIFDNVALLPIEKVRNRACKSAYAINYHKI